MWIKAYNGNLISINGRSIFLQKDYYTEHLTSYRILVGDILVYQSEHEQEAQEVLDYIWHRLEMNKNTCDLTRFKNREAERSAEWPGCEYDDKPKVHRNFEYDGIPEADK
jgi:predicted mannosyl-3-phosphoglycerate phosphatase (HAD superfamily)